MSVLTKLFGADAAIKEVVTSVGNGVGGLMDRVGFTKKMSEAEKMTKTLDFFEKTIQDKQLTKEDIDSARKMAIVQMQTQKAGFITRILNGTLRPVAGYMALISVTNKIWGQFCEQVIPNFKWEPITFTMEEYAIMGGILTFFFGLRQMSKQKGVSLNA